MPDFVVGLDLGQAADYSALVIVEKREDLGYDPSQVRTVTRRPLGMHWSDRTESYTVQEVRMPDGSWCELADAPPATLLTYDVPHLQRWPKGTSYPAIVRDVNELMARPPLGNRARLVIDGTGVGRAVVDMFRQSARYTTLPVLITAGNTVTTDDAGYTHIPKRDLVGAAQVLLQNKQLRFGAQVPDVQTLKAELQNFRVKITQAGHDQYAAWREEENDDLVLALCLALWQAERPGVRFEWLR